MTQARTVIPTPAGSSDGIPVFEPFGDGLTTLGLGGVGLAPVAGLAAYYVRSGDEDG